MTILEGLDLTEALRNIQQLPAGQQAELLDLIEEHEKQKKLLDAREHFIDFVQAVWPDFILGEHHRIMAEAFDRVAEGKLKRLIINMPPRFTKSELSSWLLPAWFLGRFPKKKIIQASNTEALAAGFGRRVRNLIDGEGEKNSEGLTPYQQIFPDVILAKDSQAAAGWHTNHGGEYFAIGVNGKVTGKGADIAIVDDAHSEQEAKQAENNPAIFDSVWDWYTSGIRQRLQPGGAIIVPMTRWGRRDLTGRAVQKMQEDAKADQWEVIEFPAILEPDEQHPYERSMWPGFWPLEELQKTRASLPVSKWQAQYMQRPTSEHGAIIKRDWWRIWGSDAEKLPAPQHAAAWHEGRPPACDFVIQSWDCAATKTDRANYTAMTEWGVFQTESDTEKDGRMVRTKVTNVILLSAFRKRMEFPELKKTVKAFHDDSAPDSILVEYKSAGIQLIQELRAMGVPVESFTGSSRGKKGPGQSNDKVARANAVADIFASGYVWRPEARWAEEVVEETNDFPNGEYDDYVDTVVQALIRFRAGNLVATANDEERDDRPRTARHRRMY